MKTEEISEMIDKVAEQLMPQLSVEEQKKCLSLLKKLKTKKNKDEFISQIRSLIYECCYGSFDASWIAFYQFFYEQCGIEECAKLEGLEKTVRECGWWWPLDEAIVMTDRPLEIHRDTQNRLHNDKGAAVLYADGWGVWASHCVRLPKNVIENPEQITVKDIEDESNAEVRRVKMEKYGLAKYLLDSGAKEVHRDERGVLYRKEIPNDEPLVMVKVINSTPEGAFMNIAPAYMNDEGHILETSEVGDVLGKSDTIPEGYQLKSRTFVPTLDQDGNVIYKEYFIRVSPDIKTASEAVAWTFGMTPEEYAPIAES